MNNGAISKRNRLYEQVYELVKEIPKGKVTTYGEIARVLELRDVRRVGWALHQNPYEGIVPCHRVVNKEGRLAPHFAFGGSEVQYKLLETEGVVFVDEKYVNMEECFYRY